MLNFYLIIIGASAGGLTPLKTILSALPKDFPAAVLIVKHISPTATSILPEILSKITKLSVIQPQNNQLIQPGNIYIAPSKFHMVVSEDKIELKKGPRVNHSIPAIDPLFYSAAINNKERTIGILLSGLLDDGSAGLLAIKKCNGISIIQDLNEAEYVDMPRNGSKAASIDYCLPAAEIATVLKNIVASFASQKNILDIRDNQLLENELHMNFIETDYDEEDMSKIAAPSVYSCPECNGVLWKINDANLERYRCRVGHAYGLETLINDKNSSTDAALWAAMRALEEKRNLTQNLVNRAKINKSDWKYFQKKLNEVEKHIKNIRKILKHDELLI